MSLELYYAKKVLPIEDSIMPCSKKDVIGPYRAGKETDKTTALLYQIPLEVEHETLLGFIIIFILQLWLLRGSFVYFHR
jgi:hypothetical protein